MTVTRSFTNSWDRRLPAIFAFVAVIALVVAVLRLMVLDGATSDLSLRTLGWVNLAHAGKASVGEMVAAYPPISFLLLLAVKSITGLPVVEANALLCAMLGALLAGLWLRAFRAAGHDGFVAVGLTLLLVVNPLFLNVLATGPENLLLMLAFWIFAKTTFSLRRFADADAIMLTSAALLLMLLTGPFGVLVACICTIGMMITFPKQIAWRDRPSVLLVVLFPAFLAAGGMMFVNWILLHDALAFMPEQFRFGFSLRFADWSAAPLAVLLACLSAPIALFATIDSRVRGVVVNLVAYILVVTAGLAMAFAIVDTVAVATALTLPACAVIAERWEAHEGHRLKAVACLLALGLIGGILSILSERPGGALASSGPAHTVAPSYSRAQADKALASFISGRSGVMIDAASHPMVVAHMQSADNLVTSDESEFQIALLRRRVSANHIVVKRPDPSRKADAITQTFPEFFESGAEGYRLAFDGDDWRVWSRVGNNHQGVSQ